MTVVLMLLGGAVGANLRYLIDRRAQRWRGSPFPWGTLTVNVLGSVVLGFVAGGALYGVDAEAVRLGVGVGLCGALTTYSTFGYETFRLATEGARALSLVNVATNVLAGMAAAAGGILLAAAIWA
ncbi:camphor resistance protein CrcB [Haloechinothrix alba]|uniref:Fluoride-specific ion channel FluC n=1 Tax=Haloechinothrix alba TaxID=664784 RepID=A0A238W9X2_9PSEU|nr:fluoride efflux transporter CrcB [Haloechinothrix alba]SNR43171.1 camphor resistance protein CrcB [Haloechinothrix alba]